MTATLIIAGDNLRRFLRNRSFYVVALLAPFAITAALSATIGAALSNDFRPTLALADPAGGPVGTTLADELRAGGFDDLRVVASAAEARSLVNDGTVAAAVVLPPMFSAESGSGNVPAAPEISVIADAGSDIALEVAESIAAETARSIDLVRLLDVLEAPAIDLSPVVAVIEDEPVGSRVLRDGTYFAVGMTAYFLFFAAAGFVATIHRERRDATLARMLISPIPRLAPLFGKALAATAAAAVSFLVLVMSSTWLLGSNWGPPVGVAAVGGGLCLGAVGLAVGVASVTSSEDAAAQSGMTLATALGILGGVFLEIPSTGILGSLARLSPFTWALEAIGLNAGTGDQWDVLGRAALIAAFGIAGFAVAFARRNTIAPV